MIKKALATLAASAVLTGCSIQQTVEPVEMAQESKLCIVENSQVREGFLQEFRKSLSVRKIAHQVVDERDIPSTCQWTATYEASWTWDLALYMSYAEIKIFNNGNLDGQVLYDSRRGGANMEKFIDAEEKIRELVNELIQHQSAFLHLRTFS